MQTSIAVPSTAACVRLQAPAICMYITPPNTAADRLIINLLAFIFLPPFLIHQ